MRTTTGIILALLLIGFTANSQKKNGTIYSEHEMLDKATTLWKAFEDGDKETYLNFFADSVKVFSNGKKLSWNKESLGKNLDWWQKEFENLKFTDDKPAYPDALKYKDGSVWVQDWVILTARHKKSGINLHLPLHRLHGFNKDKRITSSHWYYNNDVFEEIRNSGKKKENGKIYINHPHILTVRKVMNAFLDKDPDKWASFFTPKARFGHLAYETGKFKTLKEKTEDIREFLKSGKKFRIEQNGYPDCIYYAKDNYYTVYSWWNMTIKKKGKKHKFMFMLSHNFNDEGKITSEMVYVSDNHFDDW